MRCPHCLRDMSPPDPSYHECAACGGAHRIMEPCPDKPGFLRLIGMWLDGERPVEAYLAVGASCLFLFLIVLALMVAVQG
jgi:hypothetical protein